jgi:endonuclease/exonuclease/phosphatase family metal-dependent hydrolase
MANLKVVTLNMLNDLWLWPERRELVMANMAELEPDLIALQEVVLPQNNAQWLADQLGGYSVYFCPKTGAQRDKEGLAILSRMPVERDAILDLGSQNRVAQLVQIKLQQCSFAFVNAHLYWKPGDSPKRTEQIKLLLNWLDDLPPKTAIVVCGDFNGTPDSGAMRLMYGQFKSAYAAQHDREPEYTCPTPLTRARPLTLRNILRPIAYPVLNLITNHTLRPWHGTLDYIFVNEYVQVIDCAVAFNQPAAHNRKIYPSDHFGLAATLQVDNPQ